MSVKDIEFKKEMANEKLCYEVYYRKIEQY